MKIKRSFGDNFKARVALEAIKGEKTISGLFGIYEVYCHSPIVYPGWIIGRKR